LASSAKQRIADAAHAAATRKMNVTEETSLSAAYHRWRGRRHDAAAARNR